MRRLPPTLLLTIAFLVWAPAVAWALPEVVVHVTGGGEGITVTLTDAVGSTHSCSTDDTGSCEIDGVAPGVCSVVAQRGGSPTAPQSAMIPPDGKVSVIVPNP